MSDRAVAESPLNAGDLRHLTVEIVKNGKFSEVLELPLVLSMFPMPAVTEDLKSSWMECIENYASQCNTEDMKFEAINVGIASLLCFIQQNWTGPDLDIVSVPGINYKDVASLEKSRTQILKELIIDGESVNPVVQYPELLLFATTILAKSYEQFTNIKAAKQWYLRSLFIHQQILEESSPELFTKINNVMNELETFEIGSCRCNELIEIYLEFARIQLYYGYVQKSKMYIENAMKHSGIDASLIGALGKRTKFQQSDLPQLMLKVNIKNDDLFGGSNDVDCIHCPLDLNLNDEIRLDKIKYTDGSEGEYPDLSGLQQAVIFGIFCQTQKSQPKDSLADEELISILSCILDKPKVWSIQLSALSHRSKLESTHKRTIERAMLQTESLVDGLKKQEPPVRDRLKYFFTSYEPPIWSLRSSLAGMLIVLGSIKSALDIYESLQEWENVIHCYNALQLRQKAREIIEQELKKTATPKLWCLLGDATDDPSCYQKAWDLSNEKSARAQRHWAMFLYNKKDYGESIEHFQKSLDINSLQNNLWYSLGYAALHEEKWEISAQAYRRYCVLDAECFEAWNNLARCYCELKQKRRAWRALQEALKVDYSNWRVWDNYMIVSSDLKEFDEVIRSYHQVLNVKEKHLDIPVLKSLVYGLTELLDNNTVGRSDDNQSTTDIAKLKDKLLTLFGRLTSQVLNDPELWYLYSEIPRSDTPEDRAKIHQHLLKAHRSAVNKQGWEKSTESCSRILHILSKLIDVSLPSDQRSDLTSCKLAASGTVVRIKKEYPGTEMCNQVEEKLSLLNQSLER